MSPKPAPAMLPSAPPWLHLLRRRGVLAGSLLGIVGASLGVALLFGAVPGLDGPVPALAVAALLSLLLGAPLLWSLHRLATDAAAVAVAPAPQRAHGERSEAVARAQFFAQAEREWARAGRYGQTVALALIEIDRFSLVNERYGPEAAQAALHELSRQVARTLRGTDLLARIGEAQLAVLLPHADATGTVDVADRIRERAAHLQVGVLGGVVRVTVSLGVALLRPAQQPMALLVDDAEAALKAARLAGGNCVRSAPSRPARFAARGPSVDDRRAARGDGKSL